MLVLSRKVGEKIAIGSDITITITEITRGKVKVGIEAPKSVVILRHEVPDFRKVAEEGVQ